MTRSECLSIADKCVNGKRQQDYGNVEDNFRIISDLWTSYKGVAFTPVDVAMMMSLLKIARIRTGHGTEDSFVDLAGYAACGCEIASHPASYKDTVRDNSSDTTPSPSEEEKKEPDKKTPTDWEAVEEFVASIFGGLA